MYIQINIYTYIIYMYIHMCVLYVYIIIFATFVQYTYVCIQMYINVSVVCVLQAANPYVIKLSVLDDELALNVSSHQCWTHSSGPDMLCTYCIDPVYMCTHVRICVRTYMCMCTHSHYTVYTL